MDTLTILGIIALFILFGLLVYTLILTQATLRKLNLILTDSEDKLKKLNNLFNSVQNLGEIAERETLKLRNQHTLKNLNQDADPENDELTSWLISSLRLGIKMFNSRR